jgi:hypothetical protein
MGKLRRAQLQHLGVQLMKMVEPYAMQSIGQRVGITMLVFEFGERGNLAYISNAVRADMIAVVKEWLAHAERGGD